jgi:kinesin family protein 2/24
MYHKACWFPAKEAFDESAQNADVFGRCAAPLVRAVAAEDASVPGNSFSGIGTLFMYGQTGSGKSHTMEGIEAGVAETLSRLLHKTPHGEAAHHPLSANGIEVTPAPTDAHRNKPTPDPRQCPSASSLCKTHSFFVLRPQVRLRYFELVGKRCVDLLGAKAGVELKLMNDGNDAVRPAGAAEPLVADAAHLLQLLKLGKKRRATAPTDINGGSSRSHAVCQIVVARPGANGTDGGGGSSGSSGGLLTLVDCAGSERKEDSMYHDKERQRESTEINASLYALKECVRARALAAKGKNVQIPFRSSNLTKVLMESFVRPDAHLAVIATVSPIPTDTEHSISTLKTVCAIAGYPEAELVEEKADVIPWAPPREVRVPPIKWDEAQLRAWLAAVGNGRFAGVGENMPKGTTGKVVMRWGPSQFSAICGGPEVGKALNKLLTEERLRCEELEKVKRADRLG